MIESLPLAVTRVTTFAADKQLSNATGFFFERGRALYLATNRHVFLNEPSNHRPDRIEIEVHRDPDKLADTAQVSLPLYGADKNSRWRQGVDTAGLVDVAVLPIDRSLLPAKHRFRAFTPAHLVRKLDLVEMGVPVLIVGFPLGIHDLVHKLPVARQAVVASAFGVRFQGQGCFLTDARMHRGTSGAPVVARTGTEADGRTELPWMLLGVHAARLDVTNRDASQDESLDLNIAWYADILLTLTEETAPAPAKA